MTDIKIYNGNRIGGCITVISTDITKIVIDFGEALPGAEVADNIEFDWEKEQIDAVFFTHYHGDHIGRFMEIPEDIPLYMGEVTRKVLINYYRIIHKDDFVKSLESRPNITYINANEAVRIKDVTITPYSVDHSAYDAYMFLVETPDQNILHTGDYRDHGHRGHKTAKDGSDRNIMLEVIEKYVKRGGKRKIDVLITEGTMLGKRGDERRYTEKDMQQEATAFFKDHKYIFLKISSTNVDSLASFYHAAETNGMGFYGSDYIMDQLKVYREAGQKHGTHAYDFKNSWPLLPHPDKPGLNAKCKRSSLAQRRHMRENGFVLLVSGKESDEELMAEFEDLHPVLIYSLWQGYIKEDIGGGAYNAKLAAFCERHQAKTMHVGGHAYPEFIEQVIEAVGAEKVITIHTEG